MQVREVWVVIRQPCMSEYVREDETGDSEIVERIHLVGGDQQGIRSKP